MKVSAPGALAQESLPGSARAGYPAAAPTVSEFSLPAAERIRAFFLGLGLGALALAVCAAAGLLIATGPFHTSLGSLA